MNGKDTEVKSLNIFDLDHTVGPAGSSEAVVGLPCIALAILIPIIRSL
jgi:hypothetical protein